MLHFLDLPQTGRSSTGSRVESRSGPGPGPPLTLWRPVCGSLEPKHEEAERKQLQSCWRIICACCQSWCSPGAEGAWSFSAFPKKSVWNLRDSTARQAPALVYSSQFGRFNCNRCTNKTGQDLKVVRPEERPSSVGSCCSEGGRWWDRVSLGTAKHLLTFCRAETG